MTTETPRFRVYYADGSVFSGLPERAPTTGVIVIAIPDESVGGRILLHGEPFYCWHPSDSQWYSHDAVGFWMCMAKPGWKRVLFGETVGNELYQEIYRRAWNDPTFPVVKSPRQKRGPSEG